MGYGFFSVNGRWQTAHSGRVHQRGMDDEKRFTEDELRQILIFSVNF